MDSISGARILSERFRADGSGLLELGPLAAIEAVDALPLFHWTGVEPAADAPAMPPTIDAPGRRRRLLRGKRR